MPGTQEWLIILLIIIILFGAKKIPELASGLGKGIRNFKKALNEEEETKKIEAKEEKVEQAQNNEKTSSQNS